MAAQHVGEHPQGRRDYHRAWWSLLLFVVSGVAAIAVGEGLASAYGYDSFEQEKAPTWLALAVGYPALLVFAIPALVTTHYARRAVREGVPMGRVPMVLAWVGVGVFALQNALAWFFS
ncbi:hypothetical protein ACT8ZV_11735 [Nocardioides sp. MAHUQ-72]|uniref:hypothetical protein n=1 Tax=unclassified Nocardioides TaxID=2615069 RepID=UPI0036151757